jgi:hypothetical protein
VNTVVVMVEPTAFADTVTPPIFSWSGPATVPVSIDGSAAKAVLGNTTLASKDTANATLILPPLT